MISNKPSYDREKIIERLESGDFTWKQLITGFAPKKQEEKDNVGYCTYLNIEELYKTKSIDALDATQAVVEFLDTAEEESALITFSGTSLEDQLYTHIEIHPSLMLGVMGNQVIFPENNQLPRDLFACGQMRQAVSLYHSNFESRIDKIGVILNNGQIPLIKSRYLEKISKEQHPYG